jgi:hypothetical protein
MAKLLLPLMVSGLPDLLLRLLTSGSAAATPVAPAPQEAGATSPEPLPAAILP